MLSCLIFRIREETKLLKSPAKFELQIDSGLELCELLEQVNVTLQSLVTNTFVTCLVDAACCLYVSSLLLVVQGQVKSPIKVQTSI